MFFPGFGLAMTLFTGIPDSYQSYLYEPQYRGIRIEIKDPNGYPYVVSSVLLQPSIHTDIILTKTHSITLPEPYSNCADQTYTSDTITLMQLEKIAYSREICLLVLLQKNIIAKYACYDLRLPKLFK